MHRRVLPGMSMLVIFMSACIGASTPSSPTAEAASDSRAGSTPSQLAWRADLGVPLTAPTVTNGTVYVAGEGRLMALPADCATPCAPKWTGDIRDGRAVIAKTTDFTGTAMDQDAPVVAGDEVFVATERPDGFVAFSTSCRDGCQPLWSAVVQGIASEPVVADGRVFVGAGSGRVYAFPDKCRSDGKTCPPSWVTSLPGSIRKPGGGTPLALDHGVLFLISSDRSYAVDAQSGRLDWVGGPGPGGASSEGNGPAPAIDNGMVYDALWGVHPNVPHLFAFPKGCRHDGGICDPSWSAGTKDDFLSPPSLAGGMLYAGTETTPGSGDGTLYAHSPSCGASRCKPIWSTRVPSELVIGWFDVAGGVVYAVSREQGNAYAYPASCQTGCAPLWRTDVLSSSKLDIPATTSTGPYEPVFVGSQAGALLAFRV